MAQTKEEAEKVRTTHQQIKNSLNQAEIEQCVATSTMDIANPSYRLYHTLTRLDQFHNERHA